MLFLDLQKKNQFVPVPSGPVDRVRVEHPRSKRKLSPVKTREKKLMWSSTNQRAFCFLLNILFILIQKIYRSCCCCRQKTRWPRKKVSLRVAQPRVERMAKDVLKETHSNSQHSTQQRVLF